MRLWLSVRGGSNWRMGVASSSFETLPPHDLLPAGRRRWQATILRPSPSNRVLVPPSRSVLVRKRWNQYFLPTPLSCGSCFFLFSLSLFLFVGSNFIYSFQSLSSLLSLRVSWFLYFVLINKSVRGEWSCTVMQMEGQTHTKADEIALLCGGRVWP